MNNSEYIIQHQGKKYKPCITENESEMDVQNVVNDCGELIKYPSLEIVEKEIKRMAAKNKHRRFRFKKLQYINGKWSDDKSCNTPQKNFLINPFNKCIY